MSPDQLAAAEEGDISQIRPSSFYNHSQETLWKIDSSIIVTSSVGVVVHAAPEQQEELEANYYVFDKAWVNAIPLNDPILVYIVG